MNGNMCQCCGMPMGETDELYGLNADGSKSTEYCKYCYENGAFTFLGSMDEMIEICVPIVAGESSQFTEESARNMMKELFPSLKRWKK